MGLIEAQLDELKKAQYQAYYDAEDWQGAADAVKAANVRIPAPDQPVSVVSRWFSDEIDLCINVSMGVPDPDLDQITASIFLARWDRRVAGPGGMVPVGSPGFRAVLEEMVAAKIIRANERFGSTDAQIESVCTERWEPTARDIMIAVLDDGGERRF